MAPKEKSSNAGKKESLKKKAVQATNKASGSESPLPYSANSAGLVATADLEDNILVRNTNRGNAIDANKNFNMNGNSNRINGCGGQVEPPAKTDLPISPSSKEAERKIEPAVQKMNPPRRPMFKSGDQLKSWRDLRRCDEGESTDLSTTLDTIRDSIEQLTSEYSGAGPLLHGTGAGPSQSSRTIVSQLLATSRAEDSVLINTLPNEFAPRVPEWRQHVRSLVPLTGDGITQDGIGDAQFAAMASPKPTDSAYDLRRTVLESGHSTTLSQNGPLFNSAAGAPLPPMGSYAYTSGQHLPSSSIPSSAANNENSRPGGPRIASNRIGTTRGHPANALNPVLPPFNQNATQTIPSIPIIRSMELTSNQLSPIPTYPEVENSQTHTATPSVHSTIRVTNDVSSQFASDQDQTEFEITGHHRSNPSVLWADSIPSAIVPPEHRHPASRLPGDGFLSSASLDAHSFVDSDAPITLPEALHRLLLERAERIRLHAEGDVWRRQHAAEVVRRHEENVFQKRAQDGDWGLKEWHMSGEYHGQPSPGRGNRGGFGGPRGRGGGRGGRGGRGRGGFGGMGQGV
jgi:hypothetical protein